jgi:glutamine amidotransferase
MCRLLGIVSSERTDFHFFLHAAPQSLASLSLQHPHGWGVGVYDSERGWTLRKRPVRASDCEHFYEASTTVRGELLLAHVRARTVGAVTVANTHPFRRGRWLFAHNGTITNTAFLRARSSTEQQQRIEGETDSELFLAYLLTGLDQAGVSGEPASARTDQALAQAMREALAQPSFGACNFLLSNGDVLYAHRFHRSLFLLERQPSDPVRVHRASFETGISIDTPWTPDRHAILLASEAMTHEPWWEVPEGTLLRCDRQPIPSWHVLDPPPA